MQQGHPQVPLYFDISSFVITVHFRDGKYFYVQKQELLFQWMKVKCASEDMFAL